MYPDCNLATGMFDSESASGDQNSWHPYISSDCDPHDLSGSTSFLTREDSDILSEEGEAQFEAARPKAVEPTDMEARVEAHKQAIVRHTKRFTGWRKFNFVGFFIERADAGHALCQHPRCRTNIAFEYFRLAIFPSNRGGRSNRPGE